MKTDTHPTYFPQATVKCACGNTFTVGSTQQTIDIEVCSACHPIYVGDDSKKMVAGRLEKFRSRQATVATKREAAKATSAKRVSKTTETAPATEKASDEQ
jgi:large subunit ribosomal protein L31